MRAFISALFVVLLAGCAADGPEDDRRPPGGPSRASVEELRAYIDYVRPEAVGHVRFKEPLRWTYLNDYFAIMETRNGPHLIEMVSECKDLRAFQYYIDMADVRNTRGVLRAHDTIRHCRIKNLYKLPDIDAVEAKDDDASD